MQSLSTINRPPRNPRRRPWTGLVAVVIASLALAACGSDDGDSGGAAPEGITDNQGNAVQLRQPRASLAEQLGQDPVLTSGVTKETPNGCEYYAMKDRPLSNVWQFCFDKQDRVKLVATLFGVSEAPDGVSPARAALIGRADAICQSENQDLEELTKKIGRALNDFSQLPTAEVQAEVGALIEEFVGVIESTIDRIAVFDAPEEEREALEAYLDGLRSQAETLSDARREFLNDDLDAYDRLGSEFTEIGEQAKEDAEQYGFNICSASSWE